MISICWINFILEPSVWNPSLTPACLSGCLKLSVLCLANEVLCGSVLCLFLKLLLSVATGFFPVVCSFSISCLFSPPAAFPFLQPSGVLPWTAHLMGFLLTLLDCWSSSISCTERWSTIRGFRAAWWEARCSSHSAPAPDPAPRLAGISQTGRKEFFWSVLSFLHVYAKGFSKCGYLVIWILLLQQRRGLL